MNMYVIFFLNCVFSNINYIIIFLVIFFLQVNMCFVDIDDKIVDVLEDLFFFFYYQELKEEFVWVINLYKVFLGKDLSKIFSFKKFGSNKEEFIISRNESWINMLERMEILN